VLRVKRYIERTHAVPGEIVLTAHDLARLDDDDSVEFKTFTMLTGTTVSDSVEIRWRRHDCADSAANNASEISSH
jgi:hypothetical protein